MNLKEQEIEELSHQIQRLELEKLELKKNFEKDV
jgi:hypothetical protein